MSDVSNDAILRRIVEEHRPYNTYLAFRQGYRAYQTLGNAWGNPYGADSVEAQAYDRGACAAMQYQRATAYRDGHELEVLADRTATWLDRLLTGRC